MRQFAGAWLDIPRELRCRLGEHATRARSARRDARRCDVAVPAQVRDRARPAARAQQFARFPARRARASPSCTRWCGSTRTTNGTGRCACCCATSRFPAFVGSGTQSGAQLGWTSWLGARRAMRGRRGDPGSAGRRRIELENLRSTDIMGDISRVALFGKLNSLAYKAIEGATVFCKLRGNPYVELVHWFHQILQLPNSDLQLHRAGLRARRGAARARSHGGARSAAARRHVDLRSLGAHRGRDRARLGVGDAEVRRFAGAHRAPGASRCSRRATLRNVLVAHLARVRQDEAPTRSPTTSRGSSPARPKARWRERRLAARRRPRPARRAARCRRRSSGKQEALQALHGGSHRAGARGQDRSGRRPRRGDPSDHRHPDAPPAEQPDPHGRGGRRQDGGRRRLRAAHRRRRRAARH